MHKGQGEIPIIAAQPHDVLADWASGGSNCLGAPAGASDPGPSHGRSGLGRQASEVAAQGIINEVRPLHPRGDHVDLTGEWAVDALGDIDQVVVGVDVVQAAGDDQALGGGHRLGADLTPAPGPIRQRRSQS